MELTPDIMYKALVEKNSSLEGIFFAAVKTTGIFCRPTCTARKPKPENVEYFSSTREALINGYRPCKVCRPLELPGNTPDYIQSLLDKLAASPQEKISDYDLLKQNIEPNKVRRWFKANHGVTFQGYQRMLRIFTAHSQLAGGDTVTDTAFETGYNSLSGFGDAFKNITGQPPSKAKNTGIINVTKILTPLGPMLACATDEGVCLVEFTDRRMLEYELKEIQRLLKATLVYGDNKHFEPLKQQLALYFEGKLKQFVLPLVMPGTEFQKAVWRMLQNIPYGTTKSYKQQAIAINNPNAVRAVARANGFNRLCIIIPCHRVIGDDGSLTGYGGGLWRKQWLLDLERKSNI
ncbi:MAG TPA: methylated-DNA--[protein]-cysteine S-methyltransferase [Bacteroidia bacterium]|nr:methylated-DNA--[protein]-cysteine S-methyltransferase [Bacteroidia bacterium]